MFLNPKGALTAKSYAFRIRPWELSSIESFDLLDHFQNDIFIQYKNKTIFRILPKKTINNNSFISDSSRFSFDSVLFNRIKKKDKLKSIPYKFIRGVKLKNLLIVDNTIDLKISHFAKLSGSKTGNLILRKESNLNFISNLFIWNLKNSLIQFDTVCNICVICSTILSVESLLLNVKIRLKYNKKRVGIFQFGYFCNSNFGTVFLSLKASNFLNLIRQKHVLFINSINSLKTCVFIIGESLLRRFKSVFYFLNILKNRYNKILYYFISKNTSAEIYKFNSIKSLTKRFLTRLNKIIAINLEDTVQTLSKLRNKELFSFFIYNTKVSKNSKIVIPIPSVIESGGIYLNIDQRVKKKKKMMFFSKVSLGVSFLINFDSLYVSKNIFNKFFLTTSKTMLVNTFSLIMLEIFKKYSTLLNIKFFYFFKRLFNVYSFNLYPDKSIYEDKFRYVSTTQNSLIMLECSRNNRKQTTNF